MAACYCPWTGWCCSFIDSMSKEHPSGCMMLVTENESCNEGWKIRDVSRVYFFYFSFFLFLFIFFLRSNHIRIYGLP